MACRYKIQGHETQLILERAVKGDVAYPTIKNSSNSNDTQFENDDGCSGVYDHANV